MAVADQAIAAAHKLTKSRRLRREVISSGGLRTALRQYLTLFARGGLRPADLVVIDPKQYHIQAQSETSAEREDWSRTNR
jgi:hypothetical protein